MHTDLLMMHELYMSGHLCHSLCSTEQKDDEISIAIDIRVSIANVIEIITLSSNCAIDIYLLVRTDATWMLVETDYRWKGRNLLSANILQVTENLRKKPSINSCASI